MIKLLGYIVDIIASLSIWIGIIVLPFFLVQIIPDYWVPKSLAAHSDFFKYILGLVFTILVEAFAYSPILLLLEIRQLLREIASNTRRY
jgi:hypothetical protein